MQESANDFAVFCVRILITRVSGESWPCNTRTSEMKVWIWCQYCSRSVRCGRRTKKFDLRFWTKKRLYQKYKKLTYVQLIMQNIWYSFALLIFELPMTNSAFRPTMAIYIVLYRCVRCKYRHRHVALLICCFVIPICYCELTSRCNFVYLYVHFAI
jgi:hypothetical protein